MGEIDELMAALAEFNETLAFQGSIAGADSAWRGYELQTLYICSRIVGDASGDATYFPESAEDLLILGGNDGQKRIELVQVKAQDRPLTLSDIAPKQRNTSYGKDDALLGHTKFFLDRGFDMDVRVVVFGELGEELAGFSSGESRSEATVLEKIRSMYGGGIARFAREHMSFEALDEAGIRDLLLRYVGSRPEVSACPQVLLHHLTTRVRDCSRLRQYLSMQGINEDIVALGTSLAGLTGLSRQYGNTVLPLSQMLTNDASVDITDEYRAGINARPEHIVANLDVKRPRWMSELDVALEGEKVVVVRGASGQGKSTLCYRYLYDRVEVGDCHVITGIDSVETARDVCSFIVALCNARHDSVQYAYLDGARDDGWAWLAEQVYARADANIRLLVSIREEDYGRSDLSPKRFRWREVALTLEEEEAREIYDAYDSPRYPSFEESWASFGESGPLMEYTYSLGTGSTLRGMLSEQVGRLIREKDDDWIYALYLASLAGAEGSVCSIPSLGRTSGCRSMAGFVRAVDREHLLRRDGAGFVGPLHPYRSSIIADLLRDYCFRSMDEVAAGLVECAETGCGTMLVNLHARHGWRPSNVGRLTESVDGSWGKFSELLKFALWSDARDTYEECADLRRDLSGYNVSSWLLFALGGGITKAFDARGSDTLLSLATDEHWHEVLESLIERAGSYRIEYASTRAVLAAVDLSRYSVPSNSRDLTSAGFCLVQFVTCGIVDNSVSAAAQRLSDAFSPVGLPLSSALDFALGVQLCGSSLSQDAYVCLERAIDKADSVLWRDTSGSSIDLLQAPQGGKDNLNDELMAAILDYRRLYPCKESYCGSQIGVDVFVPSERMPPVQKHIPAKNLPIRWLNVADLMFYAMCEYDDSLDDWATTIQVVENSISLLERVVVGLTRWLDKGFEKGLLAQPHRTLSADILKLAKREDKSWTLVDVPKSDRDPHGFKRLSSPVDRRATRVADEEPVGLGGRRTNPLHGVSKLLNTAEPFGQRCCDLILSLRKGDSHGAEHAARSAVFLLKTIVETLDDCGSELPCLLERHVIGERIEQEILILCGVLSRLAELGIKPRHSVAYESKLRARCLKKAPSMVAERASRLPGMDSEVEGDGELTLAIDLGSPEISSIESAIARVVRGFCKEFDDTNHLTEFFLFPHYCSRVTIDLLNGGAYFASVGLTGHQLVSIASDGDCDRVLYVPVDASDRSERYRMSPELGAIRWAMGIRQLMLYAASVNRSLTCKGGDTSNLDAETYAIWAEGLVSSLVDVFGKLSESCQQIPSKPQSLSSAIESLAASVRLVPSSSDVSAHVLSIDVVLSELMSLV
ncbi:MAG: hypothetical protein Q4A07_00390 [Coriobacteriales bacterium]|nr:hypothetical protein [Coriobacteriales bacterium]